MTREQLVRGVLIDQQEDEQKREDMGSIVREVILNRGVRQVQARNPLGGRVQYPVAAVGQLADVLLDGVYFPRTRQAVELSGEVIRRSVALQSDLEAQGRVWRKDLARSKAYSKLDLWSGV